jgi:predicted phage terminase large subunit-like protein
MKKLFIEETPNLVGKEVELYGWVDTKRDHKKIVFLDLRDRTGKVQVVGMGDEWKEAGSEDVVMIKGIVKERPEKLVNPKMKTGKIEIEGKEIKIITKAEALPIPIDTDGYEVDEEIRLKYRYIDIRRERMTRNLVMKSKMSTFIRNYLTKENFIEVETPILTKTTPEGARDFIVPSRLQPGNSAIIVIQCIEENQRVLTKYKGLVPIKKLNVGDIVYSLDKSDFSLRERKVLNLKNNGPDNIYTISTDFNSIKVNKDHPFLYFNLTDGFSWRKCEDLKEGDLVCTLKNLNKDRGGFYNISLNKIRNITLETQKADVWDIQVEEDENLVCEGFIVHNTRWCEDDLAGRLIENMEKGTGEKWEVLNFPAIAEEDEVDGLMRKKGEALWPEMWSLETLLKIKNSGAMSSYTWASLYQQRPVPEGGGMFKKEWFRYFTEQPLYYVCEGKNGEATKFIEIANCWYFATIDMANKVKDTSDYTVIAIWAVSPQNELLLIKMYRDRYPYEEVFRKVKQINKEHNLEYIGIENVGIGIQLVNEALNAGLPIRALEPHGKGKENRANAPLGAVVRMESGKIFFKKGESIELETELLHFPRGKNDDTVDALSYACNELTKLDTYEENDFAPYVLNTGLNLYGKIR